VVAGVSAERGLEGYLIKAKSINSNSFIEFLEILLQNNNPLSTVLFMDNCSVHHSKKVTEFCKLLGLQTIFNVPYCPQYNPIERFWAVAKNSYKRTKLKQNSYKNPRKHEKLVRESMDSIPEDTVASICDKTLRKEVLGDE
jgi:transposase